MIFVLLAILLQVVFQAPIANPTSSPAPVSPSETPTPVPTKPAGAPRQFAPPFVEVRSAKEIDVIIAGPPRGILLNPQERNQPQSWPFSLPSLREPDRSSAIELSIYDHDGLLVARGIPTEIPNAGSLLEIERFSLDKVLPPAEDPYSVVARYRDEPSYFGSTRYLISAIPSVEFHVGSPFISVSGDFSGDVPVSTILYARSITREAGDETSISLRSRGGHRIDEVIHLPEDHKLVGAMTLSADMSGVRKQFLGANGEIIRPSFTCYNARGESRNVALRSGRHVHFDLLVRAAHTTTWIPDDPQKRTDRLGYFDYGLGTFVESPMIVGFSLAPSDVAPIPLETISYVRIFHGPCIRGYAVLRGPDQMPEVFRIVPRSGLFASEGKPAD